MAEMHDPRGSLWHRWDPHIHAPGTVLEDRFNGDWDGYLAAIEAAVPKIRALGVTDYCVLDSYEAIRTHKQNGRLSDVKFIFPNVELRYDIGVPKGSAINVHLLVRPHDDDHVEQLRSFLATLTLTVDGEAYYCERGSLIKLGIRHDAKLRENEKKALAEGVKQFKVSRDQLHKRLRTSKWARENVLTAISVSNKDGTAALQADDSFTIIRRDIEKTANIIFSSQEAQRLFWLGNGVLRLTELIERYGGKKPCIHGDDAHDLSRVGKPDGDRYTWIKGDLTFDSLRQICFEPEARVAIGPSAPTGALPSQSITNVQLSNACWFTNGSVPINSGLVAIIGARGSGKTALADIIAAASYALSGHLNDRSFVSRERAGNYLQNSTASLEWEDGDETSAKMGQLQRVLSEEPRMQYLSQQFVEILCSSEGINDKLLDEIKRVVFDAQPHAKRMGAASFSELLEIRTTRARTARSNHEHTLQQIIGQLLEEWQRSAAAKQLRAKHTDLAKAIEKDKRDRSKLIGQGSDERVKQMDAVSRASEDVQMKVQRANRRLQALLGLRDEVGSIRKAGAPIRLSQLQQSHSEAGLDPGEWQAFELRFANAVDDILARRLRETEQSIKQLTGPNANEPTGISANQPVPGQSFVSAGAVLESQTLSLLQVEAERLRALIGIDTRNAAVVRRLSDKISKDESALAQLERDLEAAEQAPKKLADLNNARQATYAAIFESIADEERQLSEIYEPLKDQLASESGALRKLSFSVRRRVDISGWADRGEQLFDLRINGAFAGHGSLLEQGRSKLLPIWLRGSSEEVAQAVADFRNAYEAGMIAQAKCERGDAVAFRRWWGDVAAWLWGTDHVSVAYSIRYDGVDVEQLSPGTRGIVLLLLYLAIDKNDDRPLIIDQPEENLDPKSIHDELVHHFRSAKRRRQIIVVTHNANIVVNADADQVIVAECGPRSDGQLPDISYTSGGLENPSIRKHVCDILEGGVEAFRERAKRLRIALY
jgi:ABC-type lipoprotein export system ATPase subunit